MTSVALRITIASMVAALTSPAVASSGRICKEEPVEVNYCAVQVRGAAAVQDVAIGKWRDEVRQLYGDSWSSWETAGGRIRCRKVGAETCCSVAAVPCIP